MPSFNLPVYAAFPSPSPPKRIPKPLPPKRMHKPILVDLPPQRPVLAVIQPPSGHDDDVPLALAAGPLARGARQEVMRERRRVEGREDGRRSGSGHARSASDGAHLYLVKPLPPLPAPSPPRQAPTQPRPSPARSRSDPIRPSPLAPRPSPPPSSTPPRRSRSPSIRALSTPMFPHPQSPPLAPLSRRYTRSAADAGASARSPVQERSIPRLSAAPSFFSILSPASSSPAPPSVGPDALLIESLVLRTLERRLAERLYRARASAVGERAGLGGLRSGREMWLWSAVRRCQKREALAPSASNTPLPPGPPSRRHVRSSSLPVFASSPSPSTSSSPSPHRDAPDPASAPAPSPPRTPPPTGPRLPRKPARVLLRPLIRSSAPPPLPPPPAVALASAEKAEQSPFAAPARSDFADLTTRHGVRLPRAPVRAAMLKVGMAGERGLAASGRARSGSGSGRGLEDWSRAGGPGARRGARA